MAAPYTALHFMVRNQVVPAVSINPGDTNLDTVTVWTPIATFKRVFAQLVKVVGVSNVSAWGIYAATSVAGANAALVVAGSRTPNAVGDYDSVECDVASIEAVLAGATHVAVKAQLATGTDGVVAVLNLFEPYYAPPTALTTGKQT